MSKTCCQARFFILILLLNLAGCSAQVDAYVPKLQGQEANLTFPYPCDSTEVTLQQSIQTPFYYGSTDGSPLFLPNSQVGRFRVKSRNDNGSCSLELTIHELMRYDQETYVLFVYKDGHILQNAMQKIHLVVDYPPGKASCVVGEDKGRGWVSIECTARSGSLPGVIECYQNGVWLPPYSTYTEIDALLNQTFLIRKAQPTFCCSILLGTYKERCQCNDTSLYLSDGDSDDPCPPSVEMTTEQTTVTQYNQSNQNSTTASSIQGENDWKLLLSLAILTVVLLLLIVIIFCYKMKNTKRNACKYFLHILCNVEYQSNESCPDPEKPCGVEQTESFL